MRRELPRAAVELPWWGRRARAWLVSAALVTLCTRCGLRRKAQMDRSAQRSAEKVRTSPAPIVGARATLAATSAQVLPFHSLAIAWP
jgi:hypothetical protein